jgi:putative addiction module killer protein
LSNSSCFSVIERLQHQQVHGQDTPEFDVWLDGLKDRSTRIRLGRRLDRAQLGNLGDVQPVGSGVFEMREHFGPGWRMYYARRGATLILMLGGGSKSTQAADISKAISLADTMEG